MIYPVNHIGPKIHILANAMSQRITEGMAPLGLTSSQAFVLRFLVSHQEQVFYPKDLEHQFDFSHPTVSGLLSRMESKGFLLCEPEPDDRRFKRIVLTRKALQYHEQIEKKIKSCEQSLMDGLTQAETVTLNNLLDRLIGNVAPDFVQRGNNL